MGRRSDRPHFQYCRAITERHPHIRKRTRVKMLRMDGTRRNNVVCMYDWVGVGVVGGGRVLGR